MDVHPVPESNRTWSRRNILSYGSITGATAVVGGLTGCSDNGSDQPDKDLKSKIDNPSDNLNKTGFPIVHDPITIQFMTASAPDTASNYNKVAIWKKYQKLTNIKIDWGLIPLDSEEEKRNLALSGDDYPEAFHSAGFEFRDVGKYGRQGIFIRLNELIDKYMPNLKKLMEDRQIKSGMTFPDGGIYGMPTIYDSDFLGLRFQNKLWARRDWLDKFDMDVPSTTQEYHDYLKAVKRRRPNGKGDTIAYSEYTLDNDLAQLRMALMGAFGVGNRGATQEYLDAEPGDSQTVRFYRISDEYKSLVEYVHRLYQEGLIAKNVFSIDQAKFQNALTKGKFGSTVDLGGGGRYDGKAKELTPVPALKGPDGKNTYNYIAAPLRDVGGFVITDKNKHPVETARWMDYFYSNAGVELFFMGVEGESYKKTGHGVEYLDKITNNPQGLTKDEALKPYVTYFGAAYPGIVKEKYFKGAESSPESTGAAKLIEPNAQDEIWPNFTYTQDEAEQLDSLADDIEKYVDESWARFVTGATPLSDWEKYVDKVKQMGLDDYLEVQQAAYDRYRKQ